MKKIFTFLAFIASYLTVDAQVINVPGDYDAIQEAIVAAQDGDTVLVAEGTYFEHINFLGKKIVVASHLLIDPQNPFVVPNTIIDGSVPARADSNSVVHFVSGEDTNSVIYGFTIQNGTGTSYKGGGVLVYNSGAKIIHNHIINNKVLPSGYGGGIYAGALGYHPEYWVIIEDNLIQGDSLVGLQPTGGGMVVSLNARIKANTIKYNGMISTPVGGLGAGTGGGIYCSLWDMDTDQHYQMEISGNTIMDNKVKGLVGTAGGVYIYGGYVVVKDNIISGNQAEADTVDPDYALGGGMFLSRLQEGSIISGNVIEDNQAINDLGPSYGGGFQISSVRDSLVSNSRIFIEKNIIRNNEAQYGAGVRITSTNACFRNNFITQNYAFSRGGGILIYGSIESADSVLMVVNNTFTGNYAPQGVAYLNYSDNLLLMNNIFYDDPSNYEIWNSNGVDSLLQIHYNLVGIAEIQGAWQGENNIDGDPEMIEGTYQLLTSSPCLGAGVIKLNIYGQEVNCPIEDIEGTPRPQSGSPEIGAYELLFETTKENHSSYLDILVYPNPLETTARISFIKQEPGPIRMTIFDVHGRQVINQVLNCSATGVCETMINAEHLSPGVYFIRLSSGNFSSQGKLVVY